jgi:hypothetical protein
LSGQEQSFAAQWFTGTFSAAETEFCKEEEASELSPPPSPHAQQGRASALRVSECLWLDLQGKKIWFRLIQKGFVVS